MAQRIACMLPLLHSNDGMNLRGRAAPNLILLPATGGRLIEVKLAPEARLRGSPPRVSPAVTRASGDPMPERAGDPRR
jgi:hypothetical protein